MSLAAYKVLHILGILFTFIALGGLLLASRTGGERVQDRKLAGMLHGIGLVIILVSGFGALARIGMSNPGIWPLWMWIKLVVWLLLGAALVLIKRAPGLRTLLWILLPVLGAVAAYMAFFKPA
ncbi:MAG TPA: hypothetical protein VJ725_32125 [Thermoanaerobaculia bacterium]|nr:hypothetical protein [Thermoanaerobaculia bacterium]